MTIDVSVLSTSPSLFPLQDIRIELLKACPLLCVHCSAYAAPHHSLQLPVQRVLALLQEFGEIGGHRVTLTGGEPLVYNGIDEIVRFCWQRGLLVRLFSSGIVVENGKRIAAKALLKQLASCIDTVMFSVYSACAETHDQVTRMAGSYALTMEAIQETVMLGICAEIHFVPTQLNYRDLPAVVARAALMGVRRVGVLRFVPQGRGKAKSAQLTLNIEQHHWLRQTILELREHYSQVTISVGSSYNALALGPALPCSAGRTQIVIEASGRILPCSAFSTIRVEDELGNILEHSLQEVWMSSRYLLKVRQILQEGHDCLGCLAQKTVVAGDLDTLAYDPLVGFLCS